MKHLKQTDFFDFVGWLFQKNTLLMLLIFSIGMVNYTYAYQISTQGQPWKVTGTILDPKGLPLPGATIVEKGSQNGTQTDFDGNFEINVSDKDAILVVSYVGFATKEIPVAGKNTIEISLETDAAALEEVVVIGYGTQKKTDVTGAITSISGDQINSTKEGNAFNAMAGKVAGLDVGITSAAPGSSPSLLIRGRSSLNFSNEPLIVVDGIPMEGSLNDINSADISSLEVLKDASSTAIYGARGANGVILITTKRGKAGKAKFTFDTYYGFAEVPENYNLLDADGYVNLRREARRAGLEEEQGLIPGTLPIPSIESSLEPLQLEAYRNGVNTDFIELGTRSGQQINYQLGASGGSETIRYNLSLSYFDQEGVYNLADYKRYTFRANLDINATDKLKIGLSQQANFSETNNYNPLSSLMNQPPLVTPFDKNGVATLDPLDDGLNWNPLSNETAGNYINEDINYRYFANIFASYQILDGLKYTLNVQPQYESITENDFRASLSQSRTGGLSQASKQTRVNTSYTIENILNYSKIFDQNHSVDATFLYSFQETKRDRLYLQVSGLANESQTFNNLSDASQIDNRDSSLETEGWVSYMGRVNYGFKSKYLLTLTGRYDGSSKLSKGQKWGFFPSASFAWRIIQEDFLKDQTVLSDLKLRTGYGQVGRNPIAPYSTFGNLKRFENSFGGNPAYGFQPENIANPNLKWETTTTFDIGLDYAFAKDRISGSIDYYTGKTTDLLLNRVLPSTSGYSFILQNVGETKNTGIELTLSTVNIETDKFRWTTNFNFSSNKSEIVKLLDSENDDVGNGWFIGESLSVYYDRVFDGIWQLDENDLANSYGRRPGDIKLADLNNDGQLNDDDRKILGQLDPKWIGGFTSKMEYANLDFLVSLYTRQGHLTRSRALENVTIFGRNNDLDLNYWSPENPSNEYPRPNINRERPLDNGVLSYVDGSFVRIRNITLGYTVNEQVNELLGLESLRFYASAQNPFLFTKTDLDGFDPELGSGDNYIASPRTILLGLNVAF